MEKQFEKVNKVLETLLKRTEGLEAISRNIEKFEQKVDSLATNLGVRVNKVESTVKDLEKAANFSDLTITNNKKTIETLLKKDSIRDNEIRQLANQVNHLENQLSNEQIARNQLAQYHRSSLNVVVVGVPFQENEDIRATICKIAEKAELIDFNVTDIDVAHRLPARSSTPSIIIRFKTKHARSSFYYQRTKLKGHTANSLGVHEDAEVTINANPGAAQDKSSKIYFLESLTPLNGELLREAKGIVNAKNYEFFGYTMVRISLSSQGMIFKISFKIIYPPVPLLSI